MVMPMIFLINPHHLALEKMANLFDISKEKSVFSH